MIEDLLKPLVCNRFLDNDSFPNIARRLDALDLSGIHSDYISPKKARKAAKARGVAKGERPYYVRIGIAWLLATALAKIPDQTREYINACRLPEDVIRLYKRKARDVNPS